MMTEPLPAWRAHASAPDTLGTMSALELDGYLTGIVVCPQPEPILPSAWLGALWGEEPVFDDNARPSTSVGAVMEQHNAIAAAIDRSLKRLEAKGVADYRPLFLPEEGKPPHDAVREWCRGFRKAMSLAPRTWGVLAADERVEVLIAPFVGFMDVADGKPFEPADNIEELLDDAAASIPHAVILLRKLANMRSPPVAMPRPHKVGRNEPCPCGSGKKYKRCCGAG